MKSKTPDPLDIGVITKTLVPHPPVLDDADVRFLTGADADDLQQLRFPSSGASTIREVRDYENKIFAWVRLSIPSRIHHVACRRSMHSETWQLLEIPRAQYEQVAMILGTSHDFYSHTRSWFDFLQKEVDPRCLLGVFPTEKQALRALREITDSSPGEEKLLEGLALQLEMLGSAASSVAGLVRAALQLDPGAGVKIRRLITTLEKRSSHALSPKRLSTHPPSSRPAIGRAVSDSQAPSARLRQTGGDGAA